MIKNIIFDIGNVLSDFRWKEAILECGFSPEVNTVLGDRIFLSDLWPEYDRGVMGDETVTEAIRKNLSGYEREFEELYKHFGEFVRERDYSLPLFEKLKQDGRMLYILSNYGDTMYRLNAAFFHFLKAADGAVFSYREKLLKPDRALYQILLDRYGLIPDECLFLDDTQKNVEGARVLGIHAENADSLETILNALHKYGINITM